MALYVHGFTFRTALNKPATTNFRTFSDQPLNAAGYRSSLQLHRRAEGSVGLCRLL